MRKTEKVLKRIALMLVLSMVLTGVAPAMQAEAESLYKKFPDYTRYENQFGKAGMTANAAAMERLLLADSYQYVYVRNLDTEQTYTIPNNIKFAEKRLRINAPLSKVVNHASLKLVKITALGGEWTEYGKGNSFSVVDPEAKIVVGTGAEVEKLYFKADNGKVDLEVKGNVEKTGFYGEKMEANITISEGTTGEFKIASEGGKVELTAEKKSEINTVNVVKGSDVVLNVNDGVEKVVVDAPANVTITGDSEKVKEVAVEVSGNAEGAKLSSDVPVKASVEAKAEITLKEGAAGSTVQKNSETLELDVKNDTGEDITQTTVTAEGDTKTEIIAGSKDDGKTEENTGNTTGDNNTGTYIPDYTPIPDPAPDSGSSSGTTSTTPSAISTFTVTATNMVGNTVSVKNSGEVNSVQISVTSTPSDITVGLTGVDSASVASVTIDNKEVGFSGLNPISFKEAGTKTIVITEKNGAKTTIIIGIAVKKEEEAPESAITGFEVTATNPTNGSITPMLSGEKGVYSGSATVAVTSSATDVTVTLKGTDISIQSIKATVDDETEGTITPANLSFTINSAKQKIIIVITETNGAKTTITIKITVKEEEKKQE